MTATGEERVNQIELLAGLPAFHAIDRLAWLQFRSACRQADLLTQDIATFAERVACLIQAELEEDTEFDEIIEACLDDADANRLNTASALRLDTAIGILATHWEHGQQLVAWQRRVSRAN